MIWHVHKQEYTCTEGKGHVDEHGHIVGKAIILSVNIIKTIRNPVLKYNFNETIASMLNSPKMFLTIWHMQTVQTQIWLLLKEQWSRSTLSAIPLSILTFKMQRKPASENVVCWIFLQTFQTNFCTWANSVDPDQTAPWGAVWAGSTFFAKMTSKITSRRQGRRQLLWLSV